MQENPNVARLPASKNIPGWCAGDVGPGMPQEHPREVREQRSEELPLTSVLGPKWLRPLLISLGTNKTVKARYCHARV